MSDKLIEELDSIEKLSNPAGIITAKQEIPRNWPAVAGALEHRMWMVNELIIQLKADIQNNKFAD